MKIRKRRLRFFILLFAASSLLFQFPPDAFAATPSDITATDSMPNDASVLLNGPADFSMNLISPQKFHHPNYFH